MAETAQSVEEMLAKRAEHVKAIEDIDATLKTIQSKIQQAIGTAEAPARRGRSPGKKPGPKPGRKGGPGRKATPVPEEDKQKLLEAMKAIGGKMRSGDAFKKAGLTKAEGKKAMAALKSDKKVKMNGPWVSVA